MYDSFFIADTHFNHARIIEYCKRPFSSAKEMNETIIKNWNDIVKPKDYVYHLGDFGWGNCSSIFNRLNGHKFLLKGSHEKDNLRHPWSWVKCCYGLNINGEYIWLSHRPHRAWQRSFHGSWHLFGHVHGKLPPYGKSFDIGVDCWSFRPVHFDEIKLEMDKLSKIEV